MTKQISITLIFITILISHASAQTCRIQIKDNLEFLKTNYGEELAVFSSLEFEINSVVIKTTDTNFVSITPNPNGFDTIRYSFVEKGIKHEDTFICKLKVGETYIISPCTCCGIFLMTPSEHAERGYVKYVNKSKQEFIAMTSEFDYDTIKRKSSSDYIFSSISMNCGFRPNTIFIANLGYLDKKFEYTNWENKSKEEKERMRTEQESYIVYAFNYLFLHGEKLVVSIDKTGKKFELKGE